MRSVTSAEMKVGNLVASISRRAGGLFHSVRNLALYTKKLGVGVTAIGLEDQFTEIDLAAWGGVPVSLYPVVGPKRFGFSPGLVGLIRNAGLELLHVHGIWMYPSVASLISCRKAKIPLIVSTHGMLDPWALRHSAWRKKIATCLYEGPHLRTAACMRALCDSEAASMREFGLRNPICVIPNGQELPPDAYDGEARNGPSLAPGRKVLLSLGRLHPKKGMPDLLRAWARVQETEPEAANWALAVAGWDQDGHESALKHMVLKLRIKDSVLFPGPLFNEKKDIALATAEAFILPSFSEGLPMAVLEAWAWRLPVLMTPQCNLPEGFAAGAAIKADPTVESLTCGLRTLFRMSDPERQHMGARGRRLVEEQFSWPQVARQMVSVYNWVLGSGPKPDCVREI